MGSLERNGESASLRPGLEGLGNGCRFEDAHRRAAAEKQLPIAARRRALERDPLPAHVQGGASVTEVVEQRRPDLVGEWQPERAACLPLRDAQPSRPPLHIVDRERHDLARAQAVGGHEEEDRVVAAPQRARAVDRLEELPNRVPGQRPWELLASIHARRVDLRVEPGRDLAARRQEPEEGSEVGHHMLKGRTRLAGADGTQKGVEIPAVERSEPRRVRLVADVSQKLPSRAAVVRQGPRRESSDLLQIGPVGGDSLLDPGQRWRWIQRQLGLAIPRQQPHQDRQIGILLRIGGSTGPQSRPRQARQGLHAALLQTADEARRRLEMLAGAFG